MKEIIINISMILLCSCNLYVDKYNDDKFKEMINIPLSTHKIPVRHESQILDYINVVIDYQSDGKEDKWKSFEESIKTGDGDCEDFCIAFCDVLKRQFDKDAEIVLVNTYNTYPTGETYCNTTKHTSRKIESGGRINHAMVRIDNKIVDPLNGKIYNAVVSFSYEIKWY